MGAPVRKNKQNAETMMLNRKMLQVAMGLALAVTSATTMAEGSGWYFGLAAGRSQADLDQAELDEIVLDTFFSVGFPVITGSSTLEDTDTTWSVVAGYRLTPFIALEASYTDFGAAEYRSSGTVNPPGPTPSAPASYSVDFAAKGFTVAAVGAIPLGEMFDIHARAGILFADMEISQTASIGAGSASETYSADSRDLLYGLGVGLHLKERWSFNLDWQQFKDVGDEDETGESDLDTLSLGIAFRL
jgi:OOP family OmpA-OmpF porin